MDDIKDILKNENPSTRVLIDRLGLLQFDMYWQNILIK